MEGAGDPSGSWVLGFRIPVGSVGAVEGAADPSGSWVLGFWVVPDGTAVDKAREIAAEISANGPLAVQAVLKSMRATRELPEAEGLALELEIGQPVFATEDAMEGPTAFAEKRTPNFQRSLNRAGPGLGGVAVAFSVASLADARRPSSPAGSRCMDGRERVRKLG